MAKKKKITQGKGRGIFNFAAGDGTPVNYIAVLKVFGIAVVLVAIGFGFRYLERYVETAKDIPHKVAHLTIDKPAWVSQDLINHVYDAAKANGESFHIDETLVSRVAHNLASVAWLQDVHVRVTGPDIVVNAQWRKPVAMYQSGPRQVYIASDLTVLDYIPLIGLPIVELKGVATKLAPATGECWQKDDVAAAVSLLIVLDKMDTLTAGLKQPLLFQISGVDVTNFNCRKSSSLPQIVLFTKDGTNINWGAPVNMSQRYVEAPDTEKLANLYDFYKANGTLSGVVKYIELRIPQKSVPAPSIQ